LDGPNEGRNQVVELRWGQGLSQEISNIIVGRNIGNIHAAVSDTVADKMVSNIDMFHA
jgi:hypothetical protein